MMVYVLLKEVTWKYPTYVIGIYKTKQQCIDAMIEDIYNLYDDMEEKRPNLDEHKEFDKIQLGEDIWRIQTCNFNS